MEGGGRVRSSALWISIAGAVGYGLASWLTNIFPIPLADDVDVRLGVAIPIFLGLIRGPWVGFFVGAAGNLLGDLLSGYITFPPDPPSGNWALDVVRGFYLHWQVGNGLMGLIPGFLAYRYARYYSFKDQLAAGALVAAGIVCGMAFASFAGMALDGTELDFVFRRVFLPATWVNLISALILVPILLFNHARLDLKSADWRRSPVLRRLTAAVLVSAALPLALMALLLVPGASADLGTGAAVTAKLVVTIVLTLAFAVVNAALIAQSVTRPLVRLSETAGRLESGELTLAEAEALQQTAGDDEISRLSRALGKMAHEVLRREERLQGRVTELESEIERLKGDTA